MKTGTTYLSITHKCAFNGFIIFVLLVLWQLGGQESGIVSMYISTPENLIEYLYENNEIVLESLIRTGTESVAGILVSISISIILLVMFFIYPTFLALVYPWVVFSQVIPFVVIAPIVILVFSPDPAAISGKIAMTSLITFFPIIGNLVAALRHLPREELEVMTLLNAGILRILIHTIFPNCISYFYSGLKIAAPISVIGAVISEFNGADIGIGKDIIIAVRNIQSEKMMLGVISSMLLASLIYVTIILVELRHGKWYKRGA